MNEWMDGWMDRQADGGTDKQMDGWMNFNFLTSGKTECSTYPT